MWIDFEGIDGSGKTTLSNVVARRLQEEGLDVLHLREGGQLGSRLSGLVRELTREQRHLELCDRAELLLNCAREVQLWEELLRPALARGRIVIADRSLYSHLAMACGGRGVPAGDARAVADFTADGLWPDLVVLVDAEPALARARKRYRKVKENRTPGTRGSRKGLAGNGLPERMRASLLQLASGDAARWLVLANDGATLEQLAEAVVAQVRSRLEHPARLAAPMPEQLEATTPAARAASHLDAASAREQLFAHLAILGDREPGAAACLLEGLSGSEAWALRERLSFAAPDAVAWSLLGRDDEDAWRLRRMLAPRTPKQVAASLINLPESAQPRAMALREELQQLAAHEVAHSLRGVSSEQALTLRRGLFQHAPVEVLGSLAGVPDAVAWAVREALGVDEKAHPHALLVGLAGDGSERAWKLRERLATADAPAVIASLKGLSCDRSHALRERWVDRAPRPVLKTLAGLDDEPSWALRTRWVERAPEALDALEDCDDPRAWALRHQAMERWPAKALRSLGSLGLTQQGQDFIARVMSLATPELGLLRACVLVTQAPSVASTAPEREPASDTSRLEAAR